MIKPMMDDVLLVKEALLPYGVLIKNKLIDNMYEFSIWDGIMITILAALIVLSVVQLFLCIRKSRNEEKKR